MSDTDKKPLDPSNLGGLYPAAKTYDEVQIERQRIRHMRQSWLPKFPKLLTLCIILGLIGVIWLIIIAVPYLMAISLMAAVFGILLLSLAWFYLLLASIRKIKALFDQVN